MSASALILPRSCSSSLYTGLRTMIKLLINVSSGSNNKGLCGAESTAETVVAWKAWLRTTCPTSDSTEISPTVHRALLPICVQLGNSITVL